MTFEKYINEFISTSKEVDIFQQNKKGFFMAAAQVVEIQPVEGIPYTNVFLKDYKSEKTIRCSIFPEKIKFNVYDIISCRIYIATSKKVELTERQSYLKMDQIHNLTEMWTVEHYGEEETKETDPEPEEMFNFLKELFKKYNNEYKGDN